MITYHSPNEHNTQSYNPITDSHLYPYIGSCTEPVQHHRQRLRRKWDPHTIRFSSHIFSRQAIERRDNRSEGKFQHQDEQERNGA